MTSCKVQVDSPKVQYTSDHILAEYEYQTSKVEVSGNDSASKYKVTNYAFKSTVIDKMELTF